MPERRVRFSTNVRKPWSRTLRGTFCDRASTRSPGRLEGLNPLGQGFALPQYRVPKGSHVGIQIQHHALLHQTLHYRG